MKKALIHTFGCQMNVHDSEKMAGVLEGEGYAITDSLDEADLIIYNTCSIREKADQKFLSELGRIKTIKKRNPALRVAVAGCIAQQMGNELFKRAPIVDFVIGPQNIHKVAGLVKKGARALAIEDNPGITEIELPALRKEKGRAWVNIMYGCNNFCTYCIVPYTRGRERSRPSESITREIKGLAEEGCKEVTLLGQNVNSYRSDINFPELMARVNSLVGIERIRFVTSHPRDLSDELIDAMASLDKVCEHIHLPLQSGSTRMLNLMNRSYTFDEYRAKVERLREKVPGIAITSDIIAGFPTETDEDHKATVKAIEELRFDGIFAFKYSKRPKTAASKMEGHLPEDIKLRRLKDILGLQDDITLEKNKPFEGTVQEVLGEGASETDKNKLTGKTRTNKIVNFKGDSDLIGRLVHVRIIKARRHSLDGEAV